MLKIYQNYPQVKFREIRKTRQRVQAQQHSLPHYSWSKNSILKGLTGSTRSPHYEMEVFWNFPKVKCWENRNTSQRVQGNFVTVNEWCGNKCRNEWCDACNRSLFFFLDFFRNISSGKFKKTPISWSANRVLSYVNNFFFKFVSLKSLSHGKSELVS